MLDTSLLNIGKKQDKYIYILYLLCPLLSLMFVFRSYKAFWAKNIVWLFTIFYGFTFYISPESSSDAVRYKETLLEMGRSNLSFQSFFSFLFSETSSYIDFVQPFITFLVSRFTTDYRFLFAVFGACYGYLYSRNIWFLINRSPKQIHFLSKLLLILFAFIVGISALNGIRFWMATHLFFFGLIALLYEQRKSGFWIALSAVFVHFSFLLPAVLLMVYLLAGNHLKIYFSIFVLSFFISGLNLAAVNNVVSYLPATLQSKSNTYLNADYMHKVETGNEGKSWFIPLINKSLEYALAGLAVFVFWNRGKYLDDEGICRVFCAALLFYGIFNILSVLPSMGRFLSLSKMLMVSMLYWVSVWKPDGALRQYLILSLPWYVLFVILQFRVMIGYSSYLLVFSNPVFSFFMDPDMGILEAIIH